MEEAVVASYPWRRPAVWPKQTVGQPLAPFVVVFKFLGISNSISYYISKLHSPTHGW